jgi:circadian clock protein KaiC
MAEHGKAHLNRLTSGVPNLDLILGGGFPEYSLNLIAGDPGSGKTTLCHQIMFANASPQRPALYFTVIGEPPIKMLRYQQQFTFFDPAKLDDTIHFVNLSREADQDLGIALEAILTEVERRNPGLVFVDSFRTLTLGAEPQGRLQMELATFLQRLTLHLTSLQATTFLVGEYGQHEPRDYSIFTIADGVVWLSQNVNRNSMVRKIQSIRMRGHSEDIRSYEITRQGIVVGERLENYEGIIGGIPRQRTRTGRRA